MFKKYIQRDGIVFGFYIYHSVKKNRKVLTIYLGREKDSLEKIGKTCSLIAQGLLWNSSGKDVDKYLRCYRR